MTEFLPVDHDGHFVFLRGWISNEESHKRQSVLILHDLGESSDQYQNILSRLFEDGFNSFSCDLRGHGQSGDRFNKVGTIAKLSKDLLQVASWIRFKTGVTPSIVAEGFSTVYTIDFQKLWPRYCKSIILISLPIGKLRAKKNSLWIIEAVSDLFPHLNVPLKFMPYYFRERSYQLGRPLKVAFRLFFDLKRHLIDYAKGSLNLKVPALFLFKKQLIDFNEEDLRHFLFKDSLRSPVRWVVNDSESCFTIRDGSKEFEDNLKLISDWLKEV